MRKRVSILLFSWFCGCAPYPPETPETKATQTILEVELMDHLEAITREETGGRATATRGYEIAGDYLVRQLTEAGVQPGWILESGEKTWRQPVPLDRYDYGPETLLRLKRSDETFELRHGQEMIILNPGSIDESLTGHPVFVGYGVENQSLGWDDYSGVDVGGRLGVIMSEGPQAKRSARQLTSDFGEAFETTFERFERLARKGVAAILAIPTRRDLWNWAATADRNLRMPLFPVQRYAEDQPPLLEVPLILLSEESVRWLFQGTGFEPLSDEGAIQPEVLSQVEAELVLRAQRTRTACFNLIGAVPGTDDAVSGEVVIISAHLDHMGITSQGVFHGANDDASGCVAVVEVMEAISAHPFRRTVLGLFTTGEEIGHFGSLHFAHNLPVPPSNVAGVLTLEHLGRVEDLDDGLEIIGTPSFLGRLQAAKPWIEDSPVLWDEIERNRSGKVWGSDTQSFRVAGLPVVLLGGGAFPEYHTPEDTAERIDLPHLRFATRVAYAIVEELANSPD